MANKIDRMAGTVLISRCLGHERSTHNRHYSEILGRPTWGRFRFADHAAKTDMVASMLIERFIQGAAGVVWLALDAPQELTGRFLRDGKVIPW